MERKTRQLRTLFAGIAILKKKLPFFAGSFFRDFAKLSKKLNDNLTFGAIIIPERHVKKNDEHLRIMNKIKSGCSFFISQATYNVEASKNFLSDYYYHSSDDEVKMVPILFNLAPCGSTKTLEFMKWLGISIPKWLENDLKYSNDVLDKSVTLSQKIFEEILEFGLEKGIPIAYRLEKSKSKHQYNWYKI